MTISKKEYLELLKKEKYDDGEISKMLDYVISLAPDLFEAFAKEDPSLIIK